MRRDVVHHLQGAYARGALDRAESEFRAFDVVQELDRLARERGRPKTLKVDNGPEFAGRMLGPVGAPERG